MNFNELNLRSEILRAISEMGYEQATDIQAGSIPSILEGQDVTGRSSTGTGKTAAFGIPIVQRTAENEDRSSVLILAPTRELALQITGEIRKYAKYLPCISVACIYGGQPMDNQIRALKKARIVVGTPGRVMDHMRRRTLKLDHLKTVVLDEADEMLNMGFIDDIRTILGSAPAERQTILFSATLSPEIIKITEEFQTETVFVKADKGKRTAAKIDQSFYYVPKDQKNDALRLLLEASAPRRALIFCNTKSMVDELSSILSDFGYRCAGLHGDMKQNQRNAVMRDFKSGRIRLLIATDVAARGIDVEDVDAVFNYDVPQELEYYVHRIGRTGRAGREGASYTLVAGRVQLSHLREIERYIHAQIEERPLPTTASILEQRETEFKSSSAKESTKNGLPSLIRWNWKELPPGKSQHCYAKERRKRTGAPLLCRMLSHVPLQNVLPPVLSPATAAGTAPEETSETVNLRKKLSAAAVVEKMDTAAGIRTPTAAAVSAAQRIELLAEIPMNSIPEDAAAKNIPAMHRSRNN